MRKLLICCLATILIFSLPLVTKGADATKLRVLDVTGQLDPATMAKILSGFKSKKSGLSAELITAADLKPLYPQDTRTNLIYNILADENIDLMIIDVRDDLLYYLNKGVLVSLKDYGVQKGRKDIIAAPCLESGGEIWGAPFDIEAYGYFYNKAVVATNNYKPTMKETTFEDCVNFHTKLKKDGKPNSFYIRSDDTLSSFYLLMSQDNIFDQLILPNTIKLTTNNIKKFGPLWLSMMKGGMVTSALEDIKANRVVDGIVSTPDFIKIRQTYPDIEWGFTSLPTMNKSVGDVIVKGKCVVMPCSAKNPADAAELVNWLTTEQSQATKSLLDTKDFSNLSNYMFPVTKNLWNNDVYTLNPIFTGITENFPLAAWVYIDFSQKEIAAEVLSMYDKILKGADLNATLGDTEKRINNILKDNKTKYPEFYNKALFGLF